MTDFVNVLAGASGLLGAKLAVSHLLTARTRAITSTYKATEDRGDWALKSIFKVLLGAYGPAIPLDRLLGVVSNSLENEPAFLLMALLLHLTGDATASDVTLVKAFVAFRFVHALTYVVAVQPFRALAFVGGLLLNLCFAARLAGKFF
eukprot:Rhum_TRINITY_DN13943_c0_g1::Rhum_TRINITY_DN13943_c0_g1_i2::g.65609::m.65609/K00799/GST, gst; glutathione S-transferase